MMPNDKGSATAAIRLRSRYGVTGQRRAACNPDKQHRNLEDSTATDGSPPFAAAHGQAVSWVISFQVGNSRWNLTSRMKGTLRAVENPKRRVSIGDARTTRNLPFSKQVG